MAGRDVHDQDITALASESLLLELTDQHLEWKFLGRHLGLTEGNLVDIERDNKESSKEMKYQTLLQWKRTSGQRATIGKLARALKKAGRTDLADYVMQDKSEEGKAEAPLVVDLVNDKNEIQMTFMVGSQSGDESATYVSLQLRSNIRSSVSLQLRSNIGSSVSLQLRSNIGSSVSLRLQSNIGPSDQQLPFEPQELGGELVADQELALLATRIAQLHAGKAFNDEQLFCGQLGIDDSVYNLVLMEKSQSKPDEKLYHVFRAWHSAYPLTRNRFCKALLNFDKLKKTSLCELYVDLVNYCFCEDS